MSIRLRQIVIPLLVLVAGVAVAALLIASRRQPEPQPKPSAGPLVRAIQVHPGTVTVVVQGTGTVRARRTVELIPQVAGRVIAVAPSFVEGGFFAAHDELLTIDPSDYEAALESARAQVARAEVQLELARAESDVARHEWERDHPGQEPPSPLVVKEPQVRQAQADLEAAKAAADTAQTNLDRTHISLPFAGRVVSKSADLGQYVAPGQVLAAVYGTDLMEIPVPLKDEDLAWFDVPGPGASRSSGSSAAVTADFAGRHREWTGRVARTEGQVDLATRTIHVVVEVPGAARDHGRALIPGMFVNVAIRGRTLEQSYAVPRHAIHEGAVLWVVRDGLLHFTPVEVAHVDGETAYLSSGLEDGDVVVTSQLEVVTDGMKVRVAASTGSAPDAGGAE